jgi:hypothetical protein
MTERTPKLLEIWTPQSIATDPTALSATVIGPLGTQGGKVLYLLWKCRKVQMLLWPPLLAELTGC